MRYVPLKFSSGNNKFRLQLGVRRTTVFTKVCNGTQARNSLTASKASVCTPGRRGGESASAVCSIHNI